MKINIILLLLACTLTSQSCTVGKLTEDSDYVFEDNKNPSQVYYTNLGEALKSTGKVSVSGDAVQIRGMNSIVGDTRPYFYVDGMPLSRNYASINNTINVQQIDEIEIIASLSKLAVYGENGNNGIISITMKKAKESN